MEELASIEVSETVVPDIDDVNAIVDCSSELDDVEFMKPEIYQYSNPKDTRK